ncbi:MAG: sigma-70 family RNA polymerase sigma factor [Isosphaeraceae bacterium]
MARGRSSGVGAQILTLFQAGAVGGLSDAQLLERFVRRGDGSEAAFEVMVARHGPMVYTVCRQILGPGQDVDDAFQATFLLLVHRARTIRDGNALAAWLHGTARRVSIRAKTDANRRRRRELRVADVESHTDDQDSDHELARLIQEEVARLPEKYRTPVLLCELGGYSHAEAARQLQCPIGTVSGRLSRARGLLKDRFARRGLTMTTGILALAAPRPAPASLIARTAARQAFSPGAVALTRSLVRAGVLAWTTRAAGLILAVALGGRAAGTALTGSTPAARPDRLASAPAPTPTPFPAPAPARTPRPPIVLGWHEDEITCLALAPDGKTLASGSVDATVKLWDLESFRERATLRGHSAPVVGLSFSPDGGLLASTDEGQTLKVWDAASGRERVSITWLPAEDVPVTPGTPPQIETMVTEDCGA